MDDSNLNLDELERRIKRIEPYETAPLTKAEGLQLIALARKGLELHGRSAEDLRGAYVVMRDSYFDEKHRAERYEKALRDIKAYGDSLARKIAREALEEKP